MLHFNPPWPEAPVQTAASNINTQARPTGAPENSLFRLSTNARKSLSSAPMTAFVLAKSGSSTKTVNNSASWRHSTH